MFSGISSFTRVIKDIIVFTCYFIAVILVEDDSIAVEIGKVLGKRIIGARVGKYGFDLILDDGSELEVYGGLKLPDGSCSGVGVSVSERVLVPVDNCAFAEWVVNRVIDVTGSKVGDVAVDSTLKGCFVSIGKGELEELVKHCDKFDETVRKVVCRKWKK